MAYSQDPVQDVIDNFNRYAHAHELYNNAWGHTHTQNPQARLNEALQALQIDTLIDILSSARKSATSSSQYRYSSRPQSTKQGLDSDLIRDAGGSGRCEDAVTMPYMTDSSLGGAPTNTSPINHRNGHEGIKHQEASEVKQRNVHGDGPSHNALTMPHKTKFDQGVHPIGTSPTIHRNGYANSRCRDNRQLEQHDACGG